MQNRRQHRGDLSERSHEVRPRRPNHEDNELFEVHSGSTDNVSESDAGRTQFFDNELARVIRESGRGRGLSKRLCRTCRSIVGWFFLDDLTWKFAVAQSSFRSIRAVSHLSPNDRCLLCSFLGRLTQRLRASGLPEGDDGYHLRATTRNSIFDANWRTHMKDHDVPAFCVLPSTRHGIREDNIENKNAYFTAHPQDDTDSIRTHRIEPYADPARLRQWIAFCDAQHQLSDCHGRSTDFSIPYFCVIDCRVSPPCLVDIDPRGPSAFVTLSYVWGQDQWEGPDEHGRLPHQFPELIRGAIWVTLTLGYRYLWIDRYCVPQNDPIRRHSLVNNMDKIYEQSVLCIVAAAARSPTDGLHGITRPRVKQQETFDFGSLSLSQVMTNIREDVRASQWNSRGWTFQEGYLARRRLVFTATQCCFQCDASWFLETLKYPTRSNFWPSRTLNPFPDRFSRKDCYQQFASCAKDYCRRQLSKDSDAIAAFTGVLNRFRSFSHVSGVPVFHGACPGTPVQGPLLWGLAWCFATDKTAALSFTKESLPQRRKEVPSWTWCAWECGSTPYYPLWKWAGLGWERLDFLATTRISVEDSDGNIAPWFDTTMKEVDEKLFTLSDVKFLRVRGWICDIAIPDTSQHLPPQNMSYGQTSISDIAITHLPRLNALARRRHMRSVGGAFIFPGWVVSIIKRSETGDFETGQVILLSGTPGEQDVERLDSCFAQFETLPNLYSDDVFLPDHNWRLQSFRIS